MRCLTGCLSNSLAVILIFLFVVIMPCAFMTFITWNIGLEADTYTEAFDSEYYNNIAIWIAPAYINAVENNAEDEEAAKVQKFAAVADKLDDDDWERLNREHNFAPPDWLETQTEGNIQAFLAYFDGEDEQLNASVNVEPLLTAFSENPNIVDSMLRVVDSWEDCSPQETRQFREFALSEVEPYDFPRCDPGSAVRIRLSSRLNEGREVLVNHLDRLETDENGAHYFDFREAMIDEAGNRRRAERNLDDFRDMLIVVDESLAAILMLPLMVLSLIIIVRVRSFKDFFLWSGIAILGAGFLTLLPIVIWLINVVDVSAEVTNTDITQAESQIFEETQNVLADDFSAPILSVSGAEIVTGFIFLMLGTLLPGPATEQPQQPSYVYVMPGTSGSSPVPGQGPVFQGPSPPPSSTPHPRRTPPPLPPMPPQPPPQANVAQRSGSTETMRESKQPTPPPGVPDHIPGEGDEATLVQDSQTPMKAPSLSPPEISPDKLNEAEQIWVEVENLPEETKGTNKGEAKKDDQEDKESKEDKPDKTES